MNRPVDAVITEVNENAKLAAKTRGQCLRHSARARALCSDKTFFSRFPRAYTSCAACDNTAAIPPREVNGWAMPRLVSQIWSRCAAIAFAPAPNGLSGSDYHSHISP